MCIIAVQPKGKRLSKEILENCWKRNSHGAGMMYAHKEKIVVVKELKSFDKFYSEYKFVSEMLDTNIVLHFRIATSAGINERNIHPFKISDEAFFCHNGILDIEVPFNSKDNDTRIYNNAILKELPKDFYNNYAMLKLIEMSIGEYNKFVILDKTGQFHIINEQAGEWHDGFWFSNSSYKAYKQPKTSYFTDIKDSYYHPRETAFVDGEWDFDEVVERYKCDDCHEEYKSTELSYIQEYEAILCNDCESIYQELEEEEIIYNNKYNKR